MWTASGVAPSQKSYTHLVPTTRPRHFVTETDDIAHALDEAAIRWPHAAKSRARLLQLLAIEGARTVEAQNEATRKARRNAIDECAGALTGVFAPDELERLRREWPE